MIYFVRDSTGAVKIGLVSSLEQMRSRLMELRIGSPHRLTVEALIDGSLADERGWHRRCLATRIRGEWFAGVAVPATAHDVGCLAQPPVGSRSWGQQRSPEAGVIYFVRCDVTGLTKIGWTGGGLGASRSAGGVWARLRSFQTSCSTPLRVVSVVDGSRSDESDLHRRHADQCDHGEWFRDVVAPPTAYPLDGFRDDVCTKPLPTVDPAAMMKACVECGAAFREKARTRPRVRCKPCRGWYALALAAASAAKPPRGPVDAEHGRRCRRARERNAALEAEWRPRVEASGGTWALFCARVGRGESPAASLGPKRRAGKKPGGSGKRTGVTERARAISADVGLNWHSVYRVLAGIAANHRRAGDILAHPLARAA